MLKLMHGDKTVAKQKVKDDKLLPVMVLEDNTEWIDRPLGLFNGIGKNAKVEKEIPISKLFDWIADRVMPKERVDCKELLDFFGLREYDPLELALITEARQPFSDNYWVDFGELRKKYAHIDPKF